MLSLALSLVTARHVGSISKLERHTKEVKPCKVALLRLIPRKEPSFERWGACVLLAPLVQISLIARKSQLNLGKISNDHMLKLTMIEELRLSKS